MKRIKQKHKNGCGIACLAMICNISYDQVLKLTFPKKSKKVKGTNVEKRQKVLFKLNKVYWTSFNKKKKISALKNNAIISYQTTVGRFHAVVWDALNKKIICPTLKNPADMNYIQANIRSITEVKS